MTLHFDAVSGSFDDTPLRDFLKDKVVHTIRDHFFTRQDVPYLAVIVTYTLPSPETPSPMTPPTKQQQGSWRDLVTDAEVPLFNTLRDWRLERSKQEGVPPYVICNNRQLAAIVKARPPSLSRLADIQGFGKAKVDKYGRDILGLVAPSADNHQAASPLGTPGGAANGHPRTG